MSASAASAIGFALKVLGAGPALLAKLKEWKGNPSKADTAQLVVFCKRLDERDVFHAPSSSEVVECCIASLDQVKNVTEETLSKVTHPGAQAMLGALLDDLKAFVRRWHGFSTPRTFRGDFPWERPRHAGDRSLATFFQELGVLRERTHIWVQALAEIEPQILPSRFVTSGRRRDGED